MIITLIFIVLLVTGLIGFTLFKSEITAAMAGIGGIGTVICIISIVIVHILVKPSQIKWENRYNGLIYKQENIESLNITGLDLVNEIVEYNNDYDSFVYWSHNPWTNWFNVKEEIINVRRIEFKEE